MHGWRVAAEQSARDSISGNNALISGNDLASEKINTNYSYELVRLYKEAFISAYQEDVRNFIEVNCSFDNKQYLSGILSELIFEKGHWLIQGDSGLGKSIIGKQLGLEFSTSRGIAINLEGKYFDSSIATTLENEISNLGNFSYDLVIASANSLKIPLLVIIDGFNECSEPNREKLVRELILFTKTTKAKLLFISQIVDGNLKKLTLEKIYVNPPTLQQKKAIVALSANLENIELLEEVINATHSGLEAKIIGEIGNQQLVGISRYRLFELYVRKKVGSEYEDICIQALFYLAKFLMDNITFSLSSRELSKLKLQKVIGNDVFIHLMKQNILKQHIDKISFFHEQLLNAFAGGEIAYATENVTAVVACIKNPLYYDRRTMILGAIDNVIFLDMVLNELDDRSILIALFYGEAGAYCKEWSLNKFRELFLKMKLEIENCEFEIIDSEYNQVSLKASSLQNWTMQELSFIYSLEEFITRGRYVAEILKLISVMDTKISKAFTILKEEAKKKRIALRSDLFSAAYLPFDQQKNSLSKVTSNLSRGYISLSREINVIDPVISDFIKHNELSNGQLYFILVIRQSTELENELVEIIKHTLKQNWRYLPYHLKIELLQHCSRHHQPEKERLEFINILNSLPEERHIMISTALIDALQMLGALEQDEVAHEETVKHELQQIFEKEDSLELFDFAFVIYSRQFDHPYYGAYLRIISELSDDQKKRFYTLSVQGADSGLFVISAIMDVIGLKGAAASKYLLKWQRIPKDSTMGFQAISIALATHIVLARFSYPIKSFLNSYDLLADNAICAIAEIYYWINRNDLLIRDRKHMCEKLWDFLNTTGLNICIHCLKVIQQNRQEIYHQSLLTDPPVLSIEQVFQTEILSIARNTIRNIDAVKYITQWDQPEEIVLYALHIIESNGTATDIPLVKRLVTDLKYGRAAIQAVKILEAHNI